jgi:hypothetical protein
MSVGDCSVFSARTTKGFYNYTFPITRVYCLATLQRSLLNYNIYNTEIDSVVITQIVAHGRQKHTDVMKRDCRTEGSLLLLQTFTFALEPV